jgi:predicted PurR-regulated permease PerM
VFAGLQAVGGLVGPVFLALVLIVAVTPISTALQRRGVPRWLATLVTLVAVYAILVGLVAALVYAVAELTALLPTYAGRVNALLGEASGSCRRWASAGCRSRRRSTRSTTARLVGFLQGVLGQVAGLLTTLLLILGVLLFMAVDAASFPERLRALGRTRPPRRARADLVRARHTPLPRRRRAVRAWPSPVLDTVVLLVLGRAARAAVRPGSASSPTSCPTSGSSWRWPRPRCSRSWRAAPG